MEESEEEFINIKNFDLNEISAAGREILKKGFPFISKDGYVYLVVRSENGNRIARIKNPVEITGKGLKK